MEKLVNIAQMNIDYLCSAEANRDGVTIKEMEALCIESEAWGDLCNKSIALTGE